MPPKASKSKETPAERPILGRFSSHLKIGIVCSYFDHFLSSFNCLDWIFQLCIDWMLGMKFHLLVRLSGMFNNELPDTFFFINLIFYNLVGIYGLLI